MPFNPDYDGDNVVATTDFLAVLPLFGSTMVNTSLICDYQGTEFEQFVAGLFDQSLVLDSIYIEYLLIDTVTTFLPGCPDPVELETILDRSHMLTDISFGQFPDHTSWHANSNYLGYYRAFSFRFYPQDGEYRLHIQDSEIGTLTSYDQSCYWNGLGPANCCSSYSSLPFPENWTINEDGIQVDWYINRWAHNCEHFRLIPFWHEAE